MNGKPSSQESLYEVELDPRENERRLKTLLSNLPGMAYRCRNDRDWTMEFVSDGCEALTGYKSNDLVGTGSRKFNSLIHTDDRDRIWAEVQETLTRGLPFQITYRICAADGREKWVWEQGVGVQNGTNPLVLEGFITDITRQKTAENERRQVEEQYKLISENTADAIWLWDLAEERCVYVSPSVQQLRGFRPEEVMAQAMDQTMPPNTLRMVLAELQRRNDAVGAGDESSRIGTNEIDFLRKDGTTVITDTVTKLLSDEQGRVRHVLGVSRDITERKRGEKVIQQATESAARDTSERKEAERRYREIFDGALEGIYRISTEKRFIAANPAMTRMLGYDSAQELVSASSDTTVELWLDPNDRERLVAILDEQGTARDFESQFKRKDGTFIWVSINCRAVRGERGETLYYDGFVEDITERRDAEQRLQAQSRRFQGIVEHTEAGYFRIGMDGCYQDVNAAWLRMYGFTSRDEAVGMHFSAVQVREDVGRADATVGALMRGEPAKSGEFSRLRRDGTVGYHSFSATPVMDGDRIICIEGFLIDVSEHKRMENALRESEEKFSRAFQSSPAALTIADLATGSYVEVNATFEQITGYRRDEVIGRRWDELGLWTSSPNRDEAVAILVRDGSLRNVEFGFRKKDGEPGTGLLSAELIELNGNPCAITASIDITQRLQLENRLRQAQKLESVGRLAGGVAHDFNNLLTVINGYSGMVLEKLRVFDPLHPYVLEIKNAGERAASLTKQLLAFSRKQLIEPRAFDLNTTIRQSAPMLQRLIGEDIALDIHLDDSLGQVLADPHQIQQVIMNLAVNARDAMPQGGRLDIETANVELGAEASTSEHPDAVPGRYVLMAVTDTGHGMDETTRHQIFEPFFTTKEVGKGTGLGLATVYGIIRQSGGWVDAWSEVGVGTSLRVYLPRTDVGPRPDENGSSVATEGGSETILVVEDEEPVRSYTVAALRRYGYRVIEASDGDTAIAVAGNHSGQIQLLLTDVIMPGMNGKMLSEKLKELYPNLKVLLTSGYTADAFADRGVIDPGDVLLHKPFAPSELAAKVREVLAGVLPSS